MKQHTGPSASGPVYRKETMKKVVIFSILALCAVTAMGQTQIKENSLYGYVMGSTWTTDKFHSAAGGIKLGTIVSIDSERKLALRTGYSSFNFGTEDNIQSIEIMPQMTWYLGQKWSFYALGGITGYTGGENTGLDAQGGFGASRRLWTDTKFVGKIPASLDVFGELIMTQARDQFTGGYAQVNIGLRFGKQE